MDNGHDRHFVILERCTTVAVLSSCRQINAEATAVMDIKLSEIAAITPRIIIHIDAIADLTNDSNSPPLHIEVWITMIQLARNTSFESKRVLRAIDC
jgi:hypothetical protein